ncbi:hypothetical protein B0T10DRAFT_557092 [Thelonectria olida]|uniref:PHD-type domain-containing protein n=1 Tax=Thelonectria olida TaxID=1576542 RepID=A0A9P8WGX0_9HYPO|nr:hypothetical protein B0T10DRAFT_557092 [Thelonectria olida]
MSASDGTTTNEAAAPKSLGPGSDIDTAMEDVSPKNQSTMPRDASQSLGNGLASLDSRADPDAQTTVTDFLDFTEYLPSDVMRSLTLIGKLDQDYADASHKVHDLTTLWGQLPSLPADERPTPVQLRADISEHLGQAVSSRTFAHAEAVRMSENVNRHYNKAKVLLAKLQTMMDNYPKEDAASPVAPKSPQMVRAKVGVRAGGGEIGQKVRRSQVPRIVVPGEVLAPYDLEYDTCTDESESSSDEESDTPAPHRTPIAQSRIKLVTSGKPQKTPSRLARPVQYPTPALSAAAAANLAALLNPPPEDAVVGSMDAPWLQLTQYELAKLRKRMKKNATWTPSETMVARELKALGRGPDAYREAKKVAEDEGKSFEPPIPTVVVDEESGTKQLPTGAISVDSVAAVEVPTSNRGMKLNEAKKIKREALAKQAAEEAEESARKMAEAAKLFLGNNGNKKGAASEAPKEQKGSKTRSGSRSTKRKREVEPEPTPEIHEPVETPSSKQQPKRIKTETPVPPPQHPPMNNSKVPTPENHSSSTSLSTPTEPVVQHLETPVPIPIPPQGSSMSTRAATSPTPSVTASGTVTTSVPVKFPPTETPVPLPMPDRRKSATPVLPPVRETPTRDVTKRETRGDAAKRSQQQQQTPSVPSVIEPPQRQPSMEPVIKQSSSRAATPGTTPGPESASSRRPSSRGKAMSQEPQPSLAADRPRRASTARNTPAPEPRPVKRTKRPAPGIVSTTNSGGNSAVGKRKAAPRKKARARKDKGIEMEEVDDEGNPIDPEEPRYCSCNRVSFGTMIQCDNENCKHEWFHLECVGLADIPARTTKWYCLDCRVLLNIGEKGEVSARGVRM